MTMINIIYVSNFIIIIIIIIIIFFIIIIIYFSNFIYNL